MDYKGTEITCTQEELNVYVAGISVLSEVRGFDQTYNNVTIPNPTGQADAKYYLLTVGESVFLQAHQPFTPGFVAITDANAAEIIEQHKQQVIDSMIIAQFSVKPEDELATLKAQQALIQAALDDLILGGTV